MTRSLLQANQAVQAFDSEAQPRHLRAAVTVLASIDLLAPQDPSDRLVRRGKVLALWLAIIVRLDRFRLDLARPPPGDARSEVVRNRLAWQCDALDQEVSEFVRQFVHQYYTSAPVDRNELSSALDLSGLMIARRAYLLG